MKKQDKDKQKKKKKVIETMIKGLSDEDLARIQGGAAKCPSITCGSLRACYTFCGGVDCTGIECTSFKTDDVW